MRKYDHEFKQQVLKKIFEGQSVASVSRELGITESLVHKWKRDALDHGANGVTGSDLKENLALKKRVKELEMEVEILKKATLNRTGAEAKTVSFYGSGKSELSDAPLVPGDASLAEWLLRVAKAARPTAENQTADGG